LLNSRVICEQKDIHGLKEHRSWAARRLPRTYDYQRELMVLLLCSSYWKTGVQTMAVKSESLRTVSQFSQRVNLP